jgi:hypothetical protein
MADPKFRPSKFVKVSRDRKYLFTQHDPDGTVGQYLLEKWEICIEKKSKVPSFKKIWTMDFKVPVSEVSITPDGGWIMIGDWLGNLMQVSNSDRQWPHMKHSGKFF